jgi:MYXO-CTERM domain-containing protein
VLNVCWTAAQESAHAFGLDHEFSFSNNRSACSDPMTYRNDCGGEKFFRNEAASCGETAARPCKCGTSQNSHQKLLSVFGAGTPITGAPSVALTSPMASGGLLGRTVAAQAGAKRGVARVALFFNGFSWAESAGAPFGKTGQPNPSSYAIPVPADLPDSIVDVKVVAYDDLGASSESAVVTVTNGAPCATAATCATGQKCEAGKCFWDPPAGELGDSCTYPQFCKSGMCEGATGQQICTQSCIPGVIDACPSGFACEASSATSGTCGFASSGAGCCSASGKHGFWGPGGMAALVLAFAIRRRRR